MIDTGCQKAKRVIRFLSGGSNVEDFAEKSSAVGKISATGRWLLRFIINFSGWLLGLVLLTQQHLVEEGLRTLQLHILRLLHEDGGAAGWPHR